MLNTNKKHIIPIIGFSVATLPLFAGAFFLKTYRTRIKTLKTIAKLTNYDDGFNLYTMDVKHDYSLNNVINYGIKDDQSMIDAILKESLPLLPAKMKAPNFGCTAFTLKEKTGQVHMGRNYDFKNNTSAMLVHCNPKHGFESVGFAALDDIYSKVPENSRKERYASLTAPFICIDGLNEKGVSIAVLTLDSEPVHQKTGKPTLTTSLAVRLVLDNASSTKEAIELLERYDMFASSGRDYHFYITDGTGDGRVIEFDCDSAKREMVVTKIDAITNFYGMHIGKVLPNQKNGIYGHGKERYDAVMKVLEEEKDNLTEESVWHALKATSQDFNPQNITSNTQWSIDYNNTDLTAKVSIRRHWDDAILYDFK